MEIREEGRGQDRSFIRDDLLPGRHPESFRDSKLRCLTSGSPRASSVSPPAQHPSRGDGHCVKLDGRGRRTRWTAQRPPPVAGGTVKLPRVHAGLGTSGGEV